MMTVLDRLRSEFADAVASAMQTLVPAGGGELPDSEGILRAIERPKDLSHGILAFPVFALSKVLRKAPPVIAADVAKILNAMPNRSAEQTFSAVSGYVNLSVDGEWLARQVLEPIRSDGIAAWFSEKNDQLVLCEYSSPNIAKPFGVGHLRSTVIGSALTRIFRRLGHPVTGINYPGDWGTQFGKMIVAFRKWGNEQTLQGNVVKNLLDLYVRYHVEAASDATLNEQARLAFLSLEQGEEEATKLWKTFSDISYAEFARIYQRLGVKFDLVIGESFFNDKMDAAIQRFEEAGLTSISDGALIVDLQDEQLPPLLLRKRDGATLYATRDLAGLMYRWDTYHFFQSLYVVGTAQADHFRQCLKGIDFLEQAEKRAPSERMTGRVKHVEFGWVKFGTQMMSTRKGNIVLLEEVLDQAVQLVRERMTEKNPNLKDLDTIAQQVGVGAVIFSQLSVKRMTDVNFRWEDVLSFEGETGPYLQYTHARLSSLLRNWKGTPSSSNDYQVLNRPEERAVLCQLAEYPEALADAARQYDPYHVSSYLLGLTSAFNKVYQRKDANGRIEKLLSDDVSATNARMALVAATRAVLADGLEVLGLAAPEEM